MNISHTTTSSDSAQPDRRRIVAGHIQAGRVVSYGGKIEKGKR